MVFAMRTAQAVDYMTSKLKNGTSYVVVALLFFVAGLLFFPTIERIKSKLRYTTGVAERLYEKWNADTIFLSESNVSLSKFRAENDIFVMYFWASWCPYCHKIVDTMKDLSRQNVSFVAMTFDSEMEVYKEYREKNNILWEDIMQKDGDGWKFVVREGEFNVPSIPSVWVIKGNKVQKIFIGEKGIQKLGSYLKNKGFIK